MIDATEKIGQYTQISALLLVCGIILAALSVVLFFRFRMIEAFVRISGYGARREKEAFERKASEDYDVLESTYEPEEDGETYEEQKSNSLTELDEDSGFITEQKSLDENIVDHTIRTYDDIDIATDKLKKALKGEIQFKEETVTIDDEETALLDAGETGLLNESPDQKRDSNLTQEAGAAKSADDDWLKNITSVQTNATNETTPDDTDDAETALLEEEETGLLNDGETGLLDGIVEPENNTEQKGRSGKFDIVDEIVIVHTEEEEK